jgi:hypothetical protein
VTLPGEQASQRPADVPRSDDSDVHTLLRSLVLLMSNCTNVRP